MARKDYKRCPGLERALNSHPTEISCPSCGGEVEIWKNEVKVRCPSCGAFVFNAQTPENSDKPTKAKESLLSRRITEEQLNSLAELGKEMGASETVIIRPKDISVEDDLAALCENPRCPNYGLSASCPPHVQGPNFFRKLIEQMEAAIFFKIDVPAEVLLSSDGPEIGRLIHEIAAGIEESAKSMGAVNSRAFAGGSCKRIFCSDYSFCNVVDKGGECRHSQYARPSMSGFGVNVKKLAESVGWKMWESESNSKKGKDTTAIVAGLILIG